MDFLRSLKKNKELIWFLAKHVDKNYVANKGTVQIKLKNTK